MISGVCAGALLGGRLDDRPQDHGTATMHGAGVFDCHYVCVALIALL